MEETYDDIPPEFADYATMAPRSVSSDSHFSFPTPQIMQPASQNYRRSPKSSPTNSTEISNGSPSMDVESGWPSPATQPGAYMIPMRAVGARPGWATTTRRSWSNRIPAFMQSFRARNTPNSPPEMEDVPTHRVEVNEVSVVQDATVVLQDAPVALQDTAPVQHNGEIVVDPKDEGQCSGRLTWVHVTILGLIFGAVIASIVWFLASNDGQSTQSQFANGTQANDHLGSGQPFEPSSSEFLAAKEAYLPLVLTVSKEDHFSSASSAQSKALIWLAASAPLDPETNKPPLSDSRLLTRYSLAVLYYSTNGDGWPHSLGFLDTDSHECDWNIPLQLNATLETAGHVVDKLGVVCNGDKDDDSEQFVEILNLANNGLGGQLPDSEMNALHHLKVGIFTNNSLTGTLPTHWKPRSIIHLDFSYNKLSSTIPSTLWTHSSKLTNLLFSGNRLHGTLSSEIGQASNLKALHLDYNGLEGSLPAELSQLEQLEELILEQNRFSSQIPTELGHLTSLAKLNLNHNTFSGQFPWESFGTRDNCVLTDLNLASNSFVGTIPWDVLSTTTQVGWTCLQQLTLKSSGFSSEALPDTAFVNWVNTLTHLDLSDTLLRGSIPTTISSLSKLELLDFGTNALTGTFPHAITELQNLRFLNLYFNSLEGPIPSTLGNMSSLLKIDIMGNRFNNTIPESLGNLSSLEILHLRQNELTGTLPTSLSHLNNLTIFSVSINNLEGSMEQFCTSGQQFLDLSADCLTEVACTCCTMCTR